ncbi:hypothetical protein IFM62136_06504 [Aspergillus lentulus]|nr:hypothetical protein IFM62136_06504 [Aspergillus lentulus]
MIRQWTPRWFLTLATEELTHRLIQLIGSGYIRFSAHSRGSWHRHHRSNVFDYVATSEGTRSEDLPVTESALAQFRYTRNFRSRFILSSIQFWSTRPQGERVQKRDFYKCDTVHAIGILLLLKYYILSYDSIDWSIRQPPAEQLLVVLSSAAFALVCHSKPSIQPE